MDFSTPQNIMEILANPPKATPPRNKAFWSGFINMDPSWVMMSFQKDHLQGMPGWMSRVGSEKSLV